MVLKEAGTLAEMIGEAWGRNKIELKQQKDMFFFQQTSGGYCSTVIGEYIHQPDHNSVQIWEVILKFGLYQYSLTHVTGHLGGMVLPVVLKGMNPHWCVRLHAGASAEIQRWVKITFNLSIFEWMASLCLTNLRRIRLFSKCNFVLHALDANIWEIHKHLMGITQLPAVSFLEMKLTELIYSSPQKDRTPRIPTKISDKSLFKKQSIYLGVMILEFMIKTCQLQFWGMSRDLLSQTFVIFCPELFWTCHSVKTTAQVPDWGAVVAKAVRICWSKRWCAANC